MKDEADLLEAAPNFHINKLKRAIPSCVRFGQQAAKMICYKRTVSPACSAESVLPALHCVQ